MTEIEFEHEAPADEKTGDDGVVSLLVTMGMSSCMKTLTLPAGARDVFVTLLAVGSRPT